VYELDSSQLGTGGTPAYQGPEILKREPIGKKLDLYGYAVSSNPHLVRIHLIIVMIRWTGLAPCEFEFPFPGSLTSTFLPGDALGDVHDAAPLVGLQPRSGCEPLYLLR